MSIFSALQSKLKTSVNQELSQSLVRTALVVIVSCYLLGYYIIFPEKEIVMPFVWAVIIYFIYCVLLVAHILLYTDFIAIRHYFTIVFDMALLGIGMYAGDVAAGFFYGGYFWLILGNGLRFGQRSLHISVVLASISFFAVIISTTFWQEHLVLGVGLMIWLFLLPPYIGKLIMAKETALEHALLADNAKSRFITNMSHELRTPLNGIIGYAQMIYEDEVDYAEAKYASEKINNAAQHLLELINELLDMASIESGKMKLRNETVRILPLIEEVKHLVEATANKRNIKLNIKTGKDQTVIADRLRFKQILVNLISNAIKYNKVNGEVSVTQKFDKNMIEIMICDTGPGLTKEEQNRLFKPFERLAANPANVEGAGIGLMITKSLVKMMGGEIGVDSEKNKGSCFWIKLPALHTK